MSEALIKESSCQSLPASGRIAPPTNRGSSAAATVHGQGAYAVPLVRLDVYSFPDPLLASASLRAAVIVSAAVTTAVFASISTKLALQQQLAVGFPRSPQEAAGDGSDVF